MSALELVQTALDTVKGRKAKRVPGPAEQRAREIQTACVQAWNSALTPQQRHAWNVFGKIWTPASQAVASKSKRKKSTASGRACFSALNNSLMQSGVTEILAIAPTKPDSVPNVPDITVTATVTPGVPSSFSLRLSAAADYPFATSIRASKALSEGVTQPQTQSVKQIAIQGTLSGSIPLDLSTSYATAWPSPEVGDQICLMLCGVGPRGFRSLQKWMMVPVTATESASAPAVPLVKRSRKANAAKANAAKANAAKADAAKADAAH